MHTIRNITSAQLNATWVLSEAESIQSGRLSLGTAGTASGPLIFDTVLGASAATYPGKTAVGHRSSNSCRRSLDRMRHEISGISIPLAGNSWPHAASVL